MLAGSIAGQKAASALISHIHTTISDGQLEPHGDSLIILDFSGIETVASSFLREFTAPFFGSAPHQYLLPENLAPAFTGISSNDLELELADFLKGRSLAVRYSKTVQDSQCGLLGELEKSVADSLAKLEKVDAASALDLFEKFPEHCSGQTTWNNRLVTLTRLRLSARTRQGRTWIYRAHRWRT